MSELKLLSPLLDNMSVLGEIPGQSGCYSLRHNPSGKAFAVKHISIPESDKQVRALILTGAYPDDEAVHAYYGTVVEAIKSELDIGLQLAQSGSFFAAHAYQAEPKESGVGYDLYILYPQQASLAAYLKDNAMTNLRAVNLGIDLCSALISCREAGYLFGNLTPENVSLTASGRFQIGGLGLSPLEDLQYASIPENYIGAYAAPELSDIAASPNETIDLYALGMILYRIYNGNHGPFEDENTNAQMADKLRLSCKAPPTPIFADYELAAIILKACAPLRENRYQSPDEMKQALTYYMQRNEVSDTLIVPPLIVPDEPVIDEVAADPEPEEPIRFTDVDTLGEDFRNSFAPDLSGSGTQDDIEEELPPAPAPSAKSKPQEESKQEEQTGALRFAVAPTDSPVDEAQPTPKLTIKAVEYAEADAFDPDQLDLDALLASVSDVVSENEVPEEATETAEAPDDTARNDYVDIYDEETPEKPKKKGKKRIILVVVLALLLAIGVGAYFFIDNYYVNISALRVARCTAQEISIEVKTTAEPDSFTLSCTDMYGNSLPATKNGGNYTFGNLTENTQYTITVTAAKGHKLTASSASTLSVTTPESTEITAFTAGVGEADGDVLLTFSYDGPAPAQWEISYSNEDGSHKGNATTDKTQANISGLRLGDNYTFTLESSGDIYLSGQITTNFTPTAIIRADKLNVASISGKTVTVTWETGENLPQNWTVSCAAPGFSQVNETVTENTFSVDVPDLTREYTFTVSAENMPEPLSLTLPANPIVVSNLDASIDDDGNITLAWETSSGEPAGGWYVTYGATASLHDPALIEATENTITLGNIIPDAEYTLSLQPADGASAFGVTETTVKSPAGGTFDAYGVKPAGIYTSLWEKPGAAVWDYRNLSNQKATFSVEEEIALCLEATAKNASDDTIWLLYVIRDSEGNPVSDASKTCAWDEMWYNRRHTSTAPNPGVAGEYTLEIYVNRQLLATAKFTIA
ncbi:MAG: hypothetical protein LBM28_04360 [Oscillospiraceae bacterium]|jgi:serine/threonine protein kinase|nr:hypothetical protein [Oscillospiraceae bacterium]